MMLYPSIDKLNEEIPSNYSLIILASKRAHQMQEYNNYLLDEDDYKSVKPVGKALEEVAAGQLQMNDNKK